MQVTASLPKPAATPKPGAPAPQPNGNQPAPDEFKANSPDKNRIGYEVAYNFGSAAGEIFKGATKAGQFIQLSSNALGMQGSGLANSLNLMGGTLDVAIGASMAKQGAFNHNNTACLLGGLQVAAGVATWGNALANTFGAPAIVGRAAAFTALGLMGVRYAAQEAGKVSAHFHKDDPKAGGGGTSPKLTLELAQYAGMNAGLDSLAANAAAVPGSVFHTQAAIKDSKEDLAEAAERAGKDRHLEKTFAAVSAVDNFGQRMGGIGGMMANFDALRNAKPDGLWGTLGMVGGTYSLIQGISTLKYSAMNHNKESTVTGAIDVVQGAATVGSAMGFGRAAGAVALGAWVAKTGYSMYAQAHRLGVGGKAENSFTGTLMGNLKNTFWGESKERWAVGAKPVPFVPFDKEAAKKAKDAEKAPKDPK